jgi:hypothetical protein
VAAAFSASDQRISVVAMPLNCRRFLRLLGTGAR